LKAFVIGLMVITFSSQAFSSDYRYEVIEIADEFNLGFGINDSGMVTGYSDNAFLYDGNELKGVGTLGGFFSSGEDVNNSGFVTGYSFTAEYDLHAFYYDGNTMNDIGTLYGGSSFGQGINDLGLVVGYSSISSDVSDERNTAFLYDASLGLMTDIGVFISGSDESYAKSINDNGLVTGSSFNSFGEESAFIFDSNDNSVISLGGLGGINSKAFDINSMGWVAGYGDNASGLNNAFIYTDSGMVNLGSLDGGASQAYGLNDSGSVVGESDGLAFLWDEGEMFDLNTLIDDSLGISLSYAEDINNLGQILVTDSDLGRSYILNPVSAVPEPSVISLFLSGLGIVWYMSFRRKKIIYFRLNS